MSLPGPLLPWPAARRPLSVVAFGNSVATLMMPARTSLAEGTYVEVLTDLLQGEGVPSVPHLESTWFGFLTDALRDTERRIRPHAPDVLVVQFGLNEYQPWLLPVPVVRHLLVKNRSTTRAGRAYRQLIAPHLWSMVRGYRRRAARLVGMRTWQTTPRRFEKALTLLIRNTRLEARPLVLVLDIDAPGTTLQHFLPGVVERHAVYQELLARVVRNAADPEVRLIHVSEITAALGPTALPDGMHYSATAHLAIGQALAGEVLGWLKERSR